MDRDAALEEDLETLPALMDAGWSLDWSMAMECFDRQRIYT